MKQSNKVTQEGVYSPSIFATQQIAMKYTIGITDSISDNFIYDEVMMVLENAEEQDEIVFNIASYGGQLSSLLSLRSGILSTKATVTGKLVSHACSAAGMLLLCCHNKIVYPNTTFHCHTASYGSYGKSGDVKAQVDFETKQIENLMYEIYEGFLDADTEIPELLSGRELYFDAEDTIRRLDSHSKLREQQHKESLQQSLDDEVLESSISLDVFTNEELAEELKLIQAEIKKRKNTKKELLGETK